MPISLKYNKVSNTTRLCWARINYSRLFLHVQLPKIQHKLVNMGIRHKLVFSIVMWLARSTSVRWRTKRQTSRTRTLSTTRRTHYRRCCGASRRGSRCSTSSRSPLSRPSSRNSSGTCSSSVSSMATLPNSYALDCLGYPDKRTQPNGPKLHGPEPTRLKTTVCQHTLYCIVFTK